MRYRAQRYPTRYPVTLKVGVVGFKSLATSVSASGICLSIEHPVPVGQAVVMDCAAGTFEGEIRWVTKDRVGVKFNRPINKPVLDLIRYGMQVASNMRRPKVGFAELR